MNDETPVSKLLLVILSIVLSPVAVFLKEKGPTQQFIINLILYLLCFSWPVAVIHALWVVLK